MQTLLFISFFISTGLAILIVRGAAKWGGRWLQDRYPGPHKFHDDPVPRIGGVAVVVATASGAAWLFVRDQDLGVTALVLVACSLPAFLAGLAEDVTKAIAPVQRLLLTAVSASLAVWFLDAVISYTAIPGVDWVASFPLGAIAITVFVVTGTANAVNIIDGFNGLSAMCVTIILGCFAYVGMAVADPLIVALSLIGMGAVLGFFIWNFPMGLIFLGDGGAYFLGFYVAEVGVLLLHRNPQVSPLFALLVCVYPVFETLFSMYRKGVLRGSSPGYPDGVHLHMLIYKRVVRWAVGPHGRHPPVRLRNSMTAPFLWVMCALAAVPGVLFWDDSAALAVAIGVFSVTYVWLYWRIVRFRTPRFLRETRRVRVRLRGRGL
jgi:UDP-N-acetylmuramyl pentapeptide phosphotransferase/UDP-N-acetylglucosamine-1-phosphate transferase